MYLVSNLTHIVCKYCKGFFIKECFYLRVKKYVKCPGNINVNEDGGVKKNCLSDFGETLIPKLPDESKMLQENVFPKMTKDGISVCAQSDPFIVQFATNFYLSHRQASQDKIHIK